VSQRFKVQIRRYGRYFAILIALVVVGTVAGFYILLQQRLPNPFQSYYTVNGAFPTAAAVVPGLGEPVQVAGVRVGEIAGVSLKSGQGVIEMDVNPSGIKHLYRNASANLVPNTPLKDMEVDITPGTRSAGIMPNGGTIPVSETTSPIDSDEVLDSLDADTRAWFTSLIADLNQGTLGRGKDIRALLNNIGPTTEQMREIGDLLAARRTELAEIVHNLGTLTKATAEKDSELSTVVRAGDTTVQALASQDVALHNAVAQLPGTLTATEKTLTDVIPLAHALGPTATALLPTARKLPTTLRDSQTLFQGAALLPLKQVPAFVSAVEPLAAQLPALTSNLQQEVPELIDAFKVLAYTTNEIAYDPGGKNPGFLYWLAWFAHNADSFISNSDANGPVWRTVALSSCASLNAFSFGSVLKALLQSSFNC
jgi:phospholipid/cholesterol/gamma-HCH transport system substrate-binding protein